MTNTMKFAKAEFYVLRKYNKDYAVSYVIEPFEKEILSLCEKFGLSGQSGGSAPASAYGISEAIKKLLLQEPISPITGAHEEWEKVSEGLWQNKRCSALFKDVDGKCWYLNAIVWKSGKIGFSGAARLILNNTDETYFSKQYVKSFPFTPKTFYIDAIRPNGKDGDLFVKDSHQLEKVFKYYDKY